MSTFNLGDTTPPVVTNITAPGTSSTSSSDVTQYTLNQIQGIATTAFESALGREPTDKELKDFLGALNKFAKANPSTSSGSKTSSGSSTTRTKKTGKLLKDQVQTNTTSGSSNDTSTSTSTGGVDVGNFIEQQLKGSTEAQAVKTDNIFMNALDFLAKQIGG